MNEQISEKSIEGTNLTDKIKSLQNELGHYTASSSKPKSINEFLDDYGNETWFIKNLTNTDVIVEMSRPEKGEDCVIIKSNMYEDLLAVSSIEKIKSSQSLRKCFNDNILKRITQAEFYEYLEKKKGDKKRADYLSKETPESKARSGIRLVVTTKMEKFKNFIKTGIGITQEDFIDWVQNEPLNEEELEYCMSSTTDKDIRTILIHKKQELIR
jgi:hypothetical protein